MRARGASHYGRDARGRRLVPGHAGHGTPGVGPAARAAEGVGRSAAEPRLASHRLPGCVLGLAARAAEEGGRGHRHPLRRRHRVEVAHSQRGRLPAQARHRHRGCLRDERDLDARRASCGCLGGEEGESRCHRLRRAAQAVHLLRVRHGHQQVLDGQRMPQGRRVGARRRSRGHLRQLRGVQQRAEERVCDESVADRGMVERQVAGQSRALPTCQIVQRQPRGGLRLRCDACRRHRAVGLRGRRLRRMDRRVGCDDGDAEVGSVPRREHGLGGRRGGDGHPHGQWRVDLDHREYARHRNARVGGVHQRDSRLGRRAGRRRDPHERWWLDLDDRFDAGYWNAQGDRVPGLEHRLGRRRGRCGDSYERWRVDLDDGECARDCDPRRGDVHECDDRLGGRRGWARSAHS